MSKKRRSLRSYKAEGLTRIEHDVVTEEVRKTIEEWARGRYFTGTFPDGNVWRIKLDEFVLEKIDIGIEVIE